MATGRGRSLNVIIAGDNQLGKATKAAEKDLDDLSRKSERVGAELVANIGESGPRIGTRFKAGLAPMAGVAAAAGIAAGAAFGKGVTERLDVEEANTKLKVQLGLTEKESGRIGKLAGQLYASNYGDSLGEVNDAIKRVMQDIDGMRDASGSRLKGITGDVISVSKAFDQDLGGTTRAVGQLMRTGLAKDAQDALNIVTAGFQAGADKSDDFLDTLNEYGTQFRKLGLDGETATGLISQGLKAGARDGDLVADSLKEFSIRALDGSETTKEGFKQLGLDADKMAERIGKGGESASKGLDMTLDRLRKIEDPVKRSQAAVQLFGTQAEDLGDALFALDPSKAVDGLGKVGGAARKVNQELGDTPKSKIQEFWRTLTTGGSSALGGVTSKLGDAAGAATKFIKGMRDGSGTGGQFAAGVTKGVDRVKSAVSDWVRENRSDINSVVGAFKTVGRFAKDVFEDTLVPIIRRAVRTVGQVIGGIATTIRGLVRLVSGLLSGDWDKAWDGAKDVVRGAFRVIKSVIVNQAEAIWEVVKDLGPKLVKGIVAGLKNMGKALATGIWEGIKYAADNVPKLAASALKGLGSSIGKAISGAVGSIFGDGLGKKIGDGVGQIGRMFPAFGGGLMGARPSMSPIAGAASRFGLGVSSGLRKGAITSSGNVSYHSTGEALDIAGSPAGMLAFFRFMKNTMGSRLAELIYTPGGAGIRNGASHTFSGAVAADHYDHVHVAIDSGAPGVGDGIGKDDRKLIQSAAASGGIGADILYGVWGAESEFSHGPGPVSKAGARGPFQFMPGTAKEMGVNPGNLRSSAYGAAKYLGRYKGRGVSGMLAAYNAGPGGNPNNPETQAYIPRVLSFARQWTSNDSGGGPSGSPSSKSKSGTASGGPVNSGGGVVERAQGMYNREELPEDVQRAQGFQERFRTGTPSGRPLKGGGPTKGFTPQEVELGVPEQIRDRMFPEQPTIWDYMDAESASAALSDTLEDDKWVAGRRVWHAEQEFAAAQASGDPRLISAAAGRLKSERDALDSLTNALKETERSITQAMDDLTAELKRSNDFAKSVQTSNEFQLTKTLADLLSGHIVGRGIAGRAFTPGAGTEYAY